MILENNMDFQTAFIYYFILLNVITFFVFGYDKRLAVKSKRRVSEFKLFFLMGIGGILGSILGMFVFRHKKSKPSFVFKTILIVGFYALLLYYFLYK